MRFVRTTRRHQSFSPIAAEPLEPRQLLAATGFNPDGPTIATPTQTPSSIVTADFDGDNKADIVMAVGKNIVFQKGFGGGRFAAPRLITHLNTDAGLLGVGDFNTDGRPDLFSVQKGIHQGWYRMLINNGVGFFSVASYGRAWTAVDSVTVGNIDLDLQDEVLLEGSGPLVATASIWGEAPDEIRVLDPLPAFIIITTGSGAQSVSTPTLLPILPNYRFNDLGPAIYGQKLGTPLITNMVGGAINNIVVGGQEQNDPTSGFIQVYAFAYQTPTPGGGITPLAGGLPAPLFNPAGDRITLAAVPTSFGAADMNGDTKKDLVVSTVTPGLTIVPFAGPVGGTSYDASTLIFPRTGAAGTLEFDEPQTIDSRSFPSVDLALRPTAPEYRIASIADFNSDGKLDVGISLVETYQYGFTSFSYVGSFIQIVHHDDTQTYWTSIVAQVSSSVPALSLISPVQLFHTADLRRTGRPDLIVADPPGSTSPLRVRVIFNVRAIPVQPWDGQGA